MKSFLGHDRPIITAMLKSHNTKDIISEIERTKTEGAEAFGFQVDMLHPQYRTRQDFRDIFQWRINQHISQVIGGKICPGMIKVMSN